MTLDELISQVLELYARTTKGRWYAVKLTRDGEYGVCREHPPEKIIGPLTHNESLFIACSCAFAPELARLCKIMKEALEWIECAEVLEDSEKSKWTVLERLRQRARAALDEVGGGGVCGIEIV